MREGHRFDTGTTLLIMPLVYEAEFAELGASLRDRLDLQRVDPTSCAILSKDIVTTIWGWNGWYSGIFVVLPSFSLLAIFLFYSA
jgi:phytoene dehydrogenase-like protein